MKALRPYQQEAFDLVWNQIEGRIQTRALVVMATGLGKTVLAAALARKWFSRKTGRILFLAHTVDILRQAREEFRGYLHVLTTTGILTSDECENLGANALFSTFQSMQIQCKTFKPDTFGLVIVDEAHHGCAVTYRQVIEYFRPQFLLGMTATPDRRDGQDIREIFGNEICAYSLAFGMAGGWLSRVDYRVLTDNLAIGELRRIIREVHAGQRVSRAQIDATIFLPERTELIVRTIRQAQEGGKQTIVFCRSIEHVEQVREMMPEALPYHSQIPFNELRERFNAFRNGRLQTLLVIDKFNEGVDIPDAELIVFLRVTDSVTLWKQQLGRGLRVVSGKDKVTVLDFVANCDRVMAVVGLGLEPTVHTQEGLPDPITLDWTPLCIEFSEELRELAQMLAFLDQGYYTYEEAQRAAEGLHPPWRGDLKAWYLSHRFQDPRLPSNPNIYYESVWGGWRRFLGREYYQSFEEVRAAVQRLNPPKEGNLAGWYLANYQRDPRLTSDLPKRFPGEWIGYPDLCGREPSFYASYEEAKEAVMRLSPPKTGSCVQWYSKNRKRDPRLPSIPAEKYTQGWRGWQDFCGRSGARRPHRNPQNYFRRSYYGTFQEAREAVKRLNPPAQGSLKGWYLGEEGACRDSSLPYSPDRVYRKDWLGWRHFCGRT